jgi:CubicO group peptidase (beta-lactamase class C family)
MRIFQSRHILPDMRSLFLALVLASLLPAQTTKSTDLSRAGMNAAKLAKIPQRMQEYVDRKEVAGIVTLVARKGVVVHTSAVGMQNIEENRPMKLDSLFQIMSMTKPFTGVAIMMMAEEGKLSLADPVARFLPEFKNQWMKLPDGTMSKPSRPVTVRDLMVHASGVPTGPCPDYPHLNQTMDVSLAAAVTCLAKMPLQFEPDSKWDYSNGGIAVLGRIVEVTSGMKFEDFIQKRILDPLGMKDTLFYPQEHHRSRIAMVYKNVNGQLVRSGGNILGGDPSKYRAGAIYPAPEWGLFSTANDLAKWLQMLLNKGNYNGVRLLSAQSVETMADNHTPHLKTGWMGNTNYGLSVEVVTRPSGAVRGLAIGSFGHGGAFGTQGWVDVKNDMITVLLVAREAGNTDFRDSLFNLAAAAIQ